MSASPQFLVRKAGSIYSDDQFIISAFDRAPLFLASMGSHEQWGSTPFSHRDGWVEETLGQIRNAEDYDSSDKGNGNGLHILIVETEWPALGAEIPDVHSRVALDGKRYLSVGFAFVRDQWIPPYIESQPNLHIDDVERECSTYLEVMVTDSGVGTLRHGAGAALIRGICDYSFARGRKTLFFRWLGRQREKADQVRLHQNF